MHQFLYPTYHVLFAILLIPLSHSVCAEEVPRSNDDHATDQQVDKSEKTRTVAVANDQLQLQLPARWKQVEQRSRIIELEFAVPVKQEGEEATPEGEQPEGRLTMMSAGGDVEANIARWIGQFRVSQNADGEESLKRDQLKVGTAVVHTLDIAGTFFDTPGGPFGPKVERPGYRMLGAIVEAEGMGKYFIKFYGPEPLVAANAKAFHDMLKSIEVKLVGADASDEATPEP